MPTMMAEAITTQRTAGRQTASGDLLRRPARSALEVSGSPAADDLARAVQQVVELPRAALAEAWTRAYGRPPPQGISRRLLEHAAAYHIQARALGTLKPATKRKLHQVAQSQPNGDAALAARVRRTAPPPGSRLVREWHGRTHTVEVLGAAFVYNGQRYRSLSAVAHAITGARWSGPRFFGL